jgi:hypothetical protein
LRLKKYIIILTVLISAVSIILFIAETSIGVYTNTTNQSLIRIKTQLPTLFRYISIYSLFILFLIASYIFLGKKCNRFICNFIRKLDVTDQFIWQNSNYLTGIDRKSLSCLSLFSICVIAVRNWSCILFGYFKYDDFEFFSTNRTEPLLSLLVTTHGDHLLPLYRIEVALMNFLFGVNPIYYNLFVSVLFALILVFAGLLLREMKTSQITIVLFAILCIGWIDWGEITAGYLCISVYIQITLLSMISIWSYFRWTKTSAKIFVFLTIVCIGSALFLDISGVWVPLGVIILSFCEFLSKRSSQGFRDWFKAHRWLLLAILILYSAFAMLNFFVFFISKQGNFLSMSGNHSHTIFSFLTQLFYLISGGLLLSPLFPVGYHLLPIVLLLPLLIVLFALAGIIIYKTVKYSEAECKWRIIYVLLIILMTATIVVIGRPMTGFNYALVTKYTGVLYLWYCLLISLIWNHYWRKAELTGKSRIATFCIIMLLWFIGHQMFFDNILFLYQAEATGYSINIAEARIRKNNVNEIRQRLMLPLLALQRSELRIPSLDGKFIYSVYPKLFKYNLSHYMDFIVPEGNKVILFKNKAMQGWTAKDVVTVTSLRSNIDSEFIKYLENDSYAQRLYLSPVELSANSVSGTAFKTDSIRPRQLVSTTTLSHQPPGSLLIHSNGAAELIIDKGDWDPEERHLLVLNVGHFGSTNTDNVKLEVHFSGELKIPYSKNYIVIPSGKQSTLSIDLLQIYSYSLNQRVGSLRIAFPVPGKYLVSDMKLI